MEALPYWLWLTMVLGTGNPLIWKLMEQQDTPKAACAALRVKKPVNYYPRTKPFGGAWKRLYYVWKAMRSWEISSKKNTVSTC